MLTASRKPVVERLLPPAPLLTVSGVSKAFGPGCPRCLELTGVTAGTNRCPMCHSVVANVDVSFEAGAGEIVGIIGESGSGKTTLLRSLFLEHQPDAGEMTVDGYGDLLSSDRPRSELRRSAVVMVHQNALAAGLAPDLAAESNIAERLLDTGVRNFAEVHAASSTLLEELGIAPARHADRLATYSGGMAQRVQLARALVAPPQVLLLDEPTTGLDPSVQADLLEEIQRVTDHLGSATVLVSHDMDVVRLLAHRVLVLRYGRVVEDGIPEQIFEDPQHPYTQSLIASRLL